MEAKVATDGANLSGKPDRGVNVNTERVRPFLFSGARFAV